MEGGGKEGGREGRGEEGGKGKRSMEKETKQAHSMYGT